MGVANVTIANLQEGSILAEDLLVENRMFMKKGTPLTSGIIKVLKNRNVKSVQVKLVEKLDGGEQTIQSLDFMKTLAVLSTEVRYGQALKNAEDIIFLRNLFNRYMENNRYRELLLAIQQRDFYTYLHVMDVFTLCTLFARKEGLPNIERLALGFLFYDIGKLKTPIDILQKNGRLSKREFAIMQQHTQDGFNMLCDLNLSQVAHLAKSHHERMDGSGYPEGLTAQYLAKEVMLLQLVDAYSAITLKRCYKAEIDAAKALEIIYQEKQLFDEKLLVSFVDFIGIYPENAVVLLSDGSHAVVEEVNNMYPLLPTVKRFDSGPSFSLPMDFQLKIDKIISYYVETPEKLFNRFLDYLMSGDSDRMEAYYYKLLEHYRPFEWFSKIYIPVYRILSVLKNQSVVSETRINEVSVKLRQLLDDVLCQLRKENKRKASMLLLVEKELQLYVGIPLLEGIFHTEGMYPFILDVDTAEDEILKLADYCGASTICVTGKEYRPISCKEHKLNLYHIGNQQLEPFVLSFADENQQNIDITVKLEKYKAMMK